MELLKKIYSLRHKNNKFLYYLKSYIRFFLVPDFLYRWSLERNLRSIDKFDKNYVLTRVDYYNKLSKGTSLGDNPVPVKDFNVKNYKSTYFFDTYQYLRYFRRSLKCNFLFGDITYVPGVPSILKSRPIGNDNINSVVMNLNKVRHFTFVRDSKYFNNKNDELVWRGDVSDPKTGRIDFFKKYFDHPRCNIGYTNSWGKNLQWAKNKMSIDEQLDYKFILCIEGVDVASNLKWVMSSNSLAVMPRPRYETWFMEGTLIPDYHYVLVKDDFSDLEEKMAYYINHSNEALSIIKNAHNFIDQFRNQKREKIISLLVLQKFFNATGQ